MHESYLRFVQGGALRAEDRRAFFAFASQVMRSVVTLRCQQRAAEKRGAGERRLTLSSDVEEQLPAGEDEILSVHEALERLAQTDARLAEVVQMRYYGGYSEQEIANAGRHRTHRAAAVVEGQADAARGDGVRPAPHALDQP